MIYSLLTILLVCFIHSMPAQEIGRDAFPEATNTTGPQTIRGGLTEFRYFNQKGLIGREEYYQNGKIKKQERYSDSKLQGMCCEWYTNGLMESSQVYKAGLFDGEWKNWSSDGQFEGVSIFQNGTGTHKTVYPNGKLKMSQSYVAGRLEGKWIEFYPNGQVESASILKDGKFFGIGVCFFSDGSIRVWGEYDEKGHLSGLFFRKEEVGGAVTASIFEQGVQIWNSTDSAEPPEKWKDKVSDINSLYNSLRVPSTLLE